MPLPASGLTGRARVRGMIATATGMAPAVDWLSPALDQRVTVSAANPTGIDQHDYLVTIPAPSGANTATLTIVEVTHTGIDRPHAWRYGIAEYNRFPILPHFVNAGTITFKAVGRWTAGETRRWHVYWNSTGTAPVVTYDHLSTISAGPLFSGLTRIGPDTENTALPTSVPAGLPLGTSNVAAVRPGFGYNNEQIVRLGRWTGNSINGTTTAAASPTITNRLIRVDASAAMTWDRPEWSGSYTAEYRHIAYRGRKSDNSANDKIKYVDAFKVTVTMTCGTAYTGPAISGSTTAPSGFDIISPAHNNTGFGGNTTMAAGNKKALWSADPTTGTITEYTTSNLGTTGAAATNIWGGAGNFYTMAVLPVSLSLTGFGSQSPTAYWSSDGNGFAYLGLRNLTNAANVPVGAQIVCTFWYIRGHTNNPTTDGDVLLADEAVAILRGLAATAPTPTVGPVIDRTAADVATSVRRASDAVVRGIQWFSDNALAYTGLAVNSAFSKDLKTGLYSETKDRGLADEDDGSYGEAHKLHGLCLKYLRTHDAALIPQIERQVQYHLDIEAAAVAAYGSYWSGSAPFWYWVSPTPGSPGHAGEGGDGVTVDPTFNGGVLGEITYSQGQPRRATSADQMHMVSHAMWAYRYLLRNEPAITANTTLWTNALNFIGRAATREETYFPIGARVYRNLHKICQGLTPLHNNGITDTFLNSADSAVLPNPFNGQGWGIWQVSNTDQPAFDPSANNCLDSFFRALYAPDTTLAGTKRWMLGMVHDFTILDPGLHEHTSSQSTWGEIDTSIYPAGWGGRGAATGNDAKYNAGRSGDKHYLDIGSGGVRDQMNGRYAQRVICTCLAALLDPTQTVRIELNSDGSTKRSMNIVDLADAQIAAVSAYLVEETTNTVRWGASGYFGGNNPKLIESAFTGYVMMALELWMLVHSGASYLDYYPVGTF